MGFTSEDSEDGLLDDRPRIGSPINAAVFGMIEMIHAGYVDRHLAALAAALRERAATPEYQAFAEQTRQRILRTADIIISGLTEHAENVSRGRAEGVRQVAAAEALREDASVRRAAANIAGKVKAAPNGALSHRDLTRSMPKTLKPFFDEAVARLVAAGRLRRDGAVGQDGPGKGARYIWTGE